MEDWDRSNPTFVGQAISVRAVSRSLAAFSFGTGIAGELFWLPRTGGKVNFGSHPIDPQKKL